MSVCSPRQLEAFTTVATEPRCRPAPTSPPISDLLARVGAEAHTDNELHDLLLDRPALMGVESLDIDQFKIRLVAHPAREEFQVGRALRVRMTSALLREGIHVPPGIDNTAQVGTS